MREITKAVKSGGKEIGVCKAPQADTWAEAQKIAGGEKEALAKFNSQVLTDAMNKMRRPSEGTWDKLLKKLPAGKAQEEIAAILKKHGIELAPAAK